MADNLTCEIVTPVKKLYSSEATYVRLPGETGSFGIMRLHAPLVAALAPGIMRVTTVDAGKESMTYFVLSGGYCQVKDNKVLVLANDAIAIDEIDVAAVQADVDQLNQTIENLEEGDSTAAYYKAQKEWGELLLKSATAA